MRWRREVFALLKMDKIFLMPMLGVNKWLKVSGSALPAAKRKKLELLEGLL